MAKASQRAMWSGAITFGLVTVPVKLYPAVREEDIHFHLLHDQDHARLKRKMVCSADEQEVHPEHQVKGYEIAPDQYVIVTQEELESVQPDKSRAIEITDFIDLHDIDPVYYDRTYYIVPQETGAKPYRLLVQAMADSHRIAIARFVMRSKEYLVALRPLSGALVMETMHFDAEVVPVTDLDEIPNAVKTDPRELKMAQQLIDSLSGKFKPGKYHDEYTQAIRAMIEKKAAGQKVVTAPETKATGKGTANLLEALQASLARARGVAGTGAGTGAGKEPRPSKLNPESPPVAPRKSAARKSHRGRS